MVIDVEKFKQDISEISGIPICNDIYTFFYDETGNCRKFSLSEKGFNSQSAVENNFILAGILFPGTEFDVNFDVLYSSLGYSEEQKELKFKHLYHNSTDFLAFIGSKRASAYLSWLSDSGLYVHYSTLNNLYYSLVDIIDSLWELYPQIVCDPMLCNEIKSAFYDFTVQYSAEITQILIDYEYPNVQDCNGFCDELCDFIRSFNNEDSCYPGFFLEMLSQMLKQAGKQGKLIFVQDNAPNKLIDEYYLFYLERCELFSKSYHVFDEEKTVQNKFNKITLSENGVEFCNYRFQNSIDNKFIQVSDLFCGLLGKLFYYLDSISEKELPQIRSKLNDVQKTNFRHIYELINKSDKKCPLFLKNANAAGNINSRIKKLIILSF